MPRLVQVISTPSGVGGAEIVVAAIHSAALERGWDSRVLNPFAASAGEALGDLVATGYESIETRHKSKALLETLIRLRRRIKQLQPEVVQAVLPAAIAAAAGVRGAKDGVTVVSHQHGNHFAANRRRIAETLDRHACARYDHVIGCSEAVRDFLVKDYRLPAAKVITIRNGWSGQPLPRDTTPRPPTVVCTARFRRQKDHATLIEGFSIARRSVPEARLVLIGDGPTRQACAADVHRRNLDGVVEFAGTQANVWPWLARADVFALASRYEPLGIAVLEAMAAGLPVVATSVGGIRELVSDARSGFLVEAGDAASLGARIAALLSDPETARSFGEIGRKRAEDQRLEVCAARYLDFFAALLDART